MPPLHRSASPLVSLARTGSHVTPTPTPTPSRPSTQRRLHLSAVGDAVVLAADGISAIHGAGAPWYLSIPLAAVAVNLTCRLPIQYYTRRLVVRRNELHPLVSAWSARHAAALARPSGDATALQSERLRRLRVAGLTEKSRRRIYKTWGVQRWKTLAPFLSMVPFVVVSEALRRLCGAPTGWISHQVGLASWGAGPGAALSDTSGLFDAQLAQGGCLWFVDLTAMDPYYLLPLICSALLARTSWGRLSRDQLGALLSLRGPSSSSAGTAPMARIQMTVGRVLLLTPLLPVLFADLPSAIFLYWATTFALNDVNESILQRLVPKRSPKLKMVSRVPPALPYLRGEN
ncbi:hypothetical protein E4U42_000941 [Claviceps africana]|uniref:Mitochondrial export translocase Oxa2 n=1 Tax=Claviceps africana TaxID=83212 RepID=A0A8K0JC68_9HYPO|nr:hypothetical protein E4U42_000941 [Claviceps africana]